MLYYVLLFSPAIICLWVGLARCYKPHGSTWFYIGAGMVGFDISHLVFDHSILGLAAIVLSIYVAYKFFPKFQNRHIAPYVEHARLFASYMEIRQYPSCVDHIVEAMTKAYQKLPPDKLPKDIHKAAEIEVYNIASFYAGSANYRDMFTELTPRGDQMLTIAKNTLEHLRQKNYITEEYYVQEQERLHQLLFPIISY